MSRTTVRARTHTYPGCRASDHSNRRRRTVCDGINTYTVDSIVGSGAFGNVWKIVDNKQSISYALKVFKRKRKRNVNAHITSEYTYLKKTKHVNCVNLLKWHGTVMVNQYPAFIFSFYQESAYHMYTRTTITERLCIRFGIGISNGLCKLHELNIIHLDIKPDNIMIDSGMNAVIIDLGNAIISGQQINTYNQSRYYRAPELLLKYDLHTTPKLDVWSAGCTIFELLLRRPLFKGSDEVAVTVRILETVDITNDDIAICAIRSMVTTNDGRCMIYNKYTRKHMMISVRSTPLEKIQGVRMEILHLLSQCLTLSVISRLTASDLHQALQQLQNKIINEESSIPTSYVV